MPVSGLSHYRLIMNIDSVEERATSDEKILPRYRYTRQLQLSPVLYRKHLLGERVFLSWSIYKRHTQVVNTTSLSAIPFCVLEKTVYYDTPGVVLNLKLAI